MLIILKTDYFQLRFFDISNFRSSIAGKYRGIIMNETFQDRKTTISFTLLISYSFQWYYCGFSVKESEALLMHENIVII